MSGDPFNPNPSHWDDLDDTSLVPTGKSYKDLNKPAPDQLARTDVASGLSLGSRASTIENRNQVAMFRCDHCRGTGRFVRGYHNPVDYGPCNKCKGSGKLKTDPETRARAKKARETKKKADTGAYIAAHVAEYTWCVSNLKFDFARSMCEAVRQYGAWTEGQLAGIRKCMARDEERKKEREVQAQAAPQLTGTGFERMLAAFASARASGLRNPKLRVGEFTFALAGERSKYAGQALFVKHAEYDYMGRIDLATARFFKSGNCGPDQERGISTICSDPLGAAVLHGKQTGHCACCGLELTNEESVRLGIGPICRGKWGL
jgi:hypothetical protein